MSGSAVPQEASAMHIGTLHIHGNTVFNFGRGQSHQHGNPKRRHLGHAGGVLLAAVAPPVVAPPAAPPVENDVGGDLPVAVAPPVADNVGGDLPVAVAPPVADDVGGGLPGAVADAAGHEEGGGADVAMEAVAAAGGADGEEGDEEPSGGEEEEEAEEEEEQDSEMDLGDGLVVCVREHYTSISFVMDADSAKMVEDNIVIALPNRD